MEARAIEVIYTKQRLELLGDTMSRLPAGTYSMNRQQELSYKIQCLELLGKVLAELPAGSELNDDDKNYIAGVVVELSHELRELCDED